MDRYKKRGVQNTHEPQNLQDKKTVYIVRMWNSMFGPNQVPFDGLRGKQISFGRKKKKKKKYDTTFGMGNKTKGKDFLSAANDRSSQYRASMEN